MQQRGAAPLCLALQVQLVVLLNTFVMVSSVFVCCSYTRGAPPCPAICESGGTCPRALWSRRHWFLVI